MLSNFRVAVLVVRYDDVARIGGGDACFAVVLSRQIALPVFFVLPNVLNAKRVTVVHQQRFAFKTNRIQLSEISFNNRIISLTSLT